MHALYRDTMEVARESLAAARKKRRAGLEAVRGLALAHGARMRRRAAGWTLLLFAASIAFVVVVPAWAAFDPSLSSLAEDGLWTSSVRAAETPGLATMLLLASWPTAVLVGAVAGRLATRQFALRIERELASLGGASGDDARDDARNRSRKSSEDAYAALAQLERTPALAQQLIASVRKEEGVSVAAWLAGASLCLPLSLHLAVALAAGTMGVMLHGPRVFWDVIRAFDGWIALSGLVAHALAATAVYAVSFARQLAEEPDALPRWQTPLILATGGAMVFPAFLLGLQVGALGFVPVFLVFITGATFLPALYGGVRRALRRERFLIAAAEADVTAALA